MHHDKTDKDRNRVDRAQRRAVVGAVGSVVVACVAWASAGVAGVDAAPVIAVAPSANLHDGDMVTVDASGFVPGETVFTAICPASPALSSDRCRVLRADETDQAGSVSARVRVRAVISGVGGGDCRLLATCVLTTFSLANPPFGPTQPVQFDPAGALAADPAWTVEPNDQLWPGDSVRVRATNLNPNQSVSVWLCLIPFGTNQPGCDSDAKRWSMTTDEVGSLDETFSISPTFSSDSLLGLGTTGEPCSIEGGCYAVALVWATPDEFLIAPIRFAPPPDPEATSTVGTGVAPVPASPSFTG